MTSAGTTVAVISQHAEQGREHREAAHDSTLSEAVATLGTAAVLPPPPYLLTAREKKREKKRGVLSTTGACCHHETTHVTTV